ncbi:MAG: hypothetical protein WBP38_01100 [Hyphomicrobium sp.]|jgi:hypothetical protein|nr:hypothetical protein [Hyphomicrobium sp.]
MSIKSVITSAVISAMAAGSLLPMASAANARDFNGHRDGGSSYSRHSNQYSNYNNHNRGWRRHGGQNYAYGGPRRHNGYYGRHRDHTGRNLAIGAFATILGIAIASEISRDHRGGYRD